MISRVYGGIGAMLCVCVWVSVVVRPAWGAEEVWPGRQWTTATPEQAGMDRKQLEKARDHALSGGGSGCIIRRGRLVLAWGSQKRRYDLKSTTKSIGVTALGLAIADGKIKLTDKALRHHRSLGRNPAGNVKTGWLDKITIFHLATQTAGFDKSGGYTKLLFAPGEKWSYSDGGPNWLAECVTLAYRQDVHELMTKRVFAPLGIGATDLTWRRNSYRPAKIDNVARREFGSGISANVNAMARIGLLYLREGRWRDKQIIPRSFVAVARATPEALKDLPVVRGKQYPRASSHYGLLWWNNADGTLKSVPRETYWSWGLYDSLIVVIPPLDIVIARAGKSFRGGWDAGYDKLAGFFGPVVASVRSKGADASAAGPRQVSPAIARLTWAPEKTIIRRASGSDNWPITWGDDDRLYTAYGDGWGFAPKIKGKLSLGLARVEGTPPKITGVNIRSATGEKKGDGPRGVKASGMLMVEGVLYLWGRNADRAGKGARLAWSKDRGKTWTPSPWTFSQFGYCTFVNYGKNYAGARDSYIYTVTPDGPSAYKPTDRFILMRVGKDRIAAREAWEFLESRDKNGKGVWTKDISRRGAVFSRRGGCLRSGISYNAPLGRYLWWQQNAGGGSDSRAAGGFGVYDAPEPWGPWTQVYFTRKWDVGPGETGCFPTKWISRDGKTLWLLFSGGDNFSLRKATLTLTKAKKN